MITKYCIPCDLWIDSCEDRKSQSRIQMKLVSEPRYNINIKNWDMNCINLVVQSYNKVYRVVGHQLGHLEGEELEEIQQFHNTGYQPSWRFNPAPLISKMTAIDVSRLNIQNKCNDYVIPWPMLQFTGHQ